MTEISLGLQWQPGKARAGDPVRYTRDRHITIFGPTRSGKGVGLEIPNLLRLSGLSIINIDPKGQNLAVTGRWRKTVSDVAVLNPLDVFGAGSSGFNPLVALDPGGPRFFEEAAAIAEAMIRIEGNDPFFSESARGLILALIMWEVRLARAAGRMPLLEHVRVMLGGDLVATAKDMLASGDLQIANLGGRFREESRTNSSIIQTAETQTRWLLSSQIRADLAKDGIDFATLKQRATTVYVVLPADQLTTFSPWLRLVVTSAMNALYRQGGGGLRTLFMLSEFARIGHMESVAAALGQGAGYGIQLMPVLQDVNQLRQNFGPNEANTFLGMSGAIFGFTPNDGETAAWMSARSSTVMTPGLSASDQQGARAHETWRSERRPLYEPGDLYNIPDFHGLVWFAGEAAPVPVFAPPYWDTYHNPDLLGRYDPDPYHPESANPSAWTRFRRRFRLVGRKHKTIRERRWERITGTIGLAISAFIVISVMREHPPRIGGTASSGARTATVVQTDLNLRQGPGPTYPVVTIMPLGTRVTIIRDAGNGWEEINVRASDGSMLHGFANGSYLSAAP